MRLARITIAAGVLIAGVLATDAYFWIDRKSGERYARQMCDRDGGLSIHETTYAEGFLDESGDPNWCVACIDRLAKAKFQYIDVHVPGNPNTADSSAKRPGYYRLSTAQRGDPRCERWKQYGLLARWENQEKISGMDTALCVAIDPLEGKPDGPVLTEIQEQVTNDRGVDVRVHRFQLSDARSGRSYAVFKDYLYYAQWDQIFFSAGGYIPKGNRICSSPMKYVEDVTSIPEKVLRDKSKMPSSQSEQQRSIR